MLLEIHDLHATYGLGQVLGGFDLHVDDSEVVTLLGRNGMGKTTTISCISGMLRPSGGRIRFRGTDLARLKPHEMARHGIGLVPEGRRIFPNLTVRENLLMAARPGRDGRNDWTYDRVMQTFPRLTERLTNMGNQLSGGEQQMLSIGRALMTHPELIILDEATEGLAPLIVNEIWNVIADIRDSGIATLIVDRDYRRVLAHSDQAIVLQKGLVELSGSSDAVALNPALPKLLGV